MLVESPALFRFQPVVGSPFYLFVYHEIVCASKCTISGVGVSLATVGFYSSFQIASFDAFSNEVVNEFSIFGVRVVSPVGLPIFGNSFRVAPNMYQLNYLAFTKAGASTMIVQHFVPGGVLATYYDGDLLENAVDVIQQSQIFINNVIC